MLLGVGCTPDDGGTSGDASEPVLTVTPAVLATTYAGETFELTVASNVNWKVSCDQADVEISPVSGSNDAVVTVVVPEVTADRVFPITFSGKKMVYYPEANTSIEVPVEATVTVHQNAAGTDKIQTNVKTIRDLVVAANPGTAKTDLPEEVRALTLTGIVVGTPNGNMGNDFLLAIQDDTTEPGHGLTISCSGSVANITKGQTVKVSLAGAKAQWYNGLLQVAVYETLESVGTPVEVSPIEVAYADLLQYESQYVKVSDKVTPASTAVGKAWNSGTNGANVNFTTEAGKTLVVRVSKDASFKSEIVPAKSGYLCGVASRFNNDVQLLPQYTSDILLSENASELESTVVTIAEITEAGTYKVENAWVVGYTGNGPILTDESGAFINTYIYGSTYKTLGQKVTVEGNVSVRQGGFQFNTPTITALEGTVDVVYPTPATYEGAELEAFCDKYAASGAAYLCEYVSLKGVVIKSAEGHYGISFSGVDGAKYEGSLSKTPAESLGLEALIGTPVVLCGFVTDYNAPYLSITATSVEVDATAVGIFAEAITGVPAEGVTGATHNITVVGVESVSTEVDGTIVTAASVAGNVLTYTVAANEGEVREGWIKLSAEGVETVTIAVKQSSALAYNFMSDDAFVDSSENYKGESKVNGSETNASGFKLGTSSAAGYFASKAVGVEGDVTLEFYAVAWKGNTNTLYVRKQGSTDILGQFQLKSNDGATNKAPYSMTLTDDNYYSVAVSGVTANTVFEFSTDASFTKASNNSGRALVVGVHLVGGTPSTPTEPDPTPTPTPTVKTLPYSEAFSASQGDFTISDVLLPEVSTYVWKQDPSYGNISASAYIGGVNYASESWLVSPQISLNGATAPELTFDHTHKYAGTPSEELTLWVSENNGETWTQLTIPTYATNNDNNYVTPAIDLTAYVGKTVNVAFKYISSTTASGTWRLKNFKVAEKSTTVEPEPEQPGQGGGEGGETPETPASGETITGLTHIENLDGVAAGKYYFAAYSTKNSSAEVFTNYPYHLWTGTVTSGKADTANYAYADGVLTRDPNHTSAAPETEVAVEAELVAVEGKTNVYYIKFNNSYLSVSGYTANHKLVMSETALEWTAVEHTDGVVFQATDGTNSVTLCTGTAANDLLRQYKTATFETSITNNQPYNGVHLFKKN